MAGRVTLNINSPCKATIWTISISLPPRWSKQFKTIPIISDVSSDQQNRGLQAMIQYDRGTAARFGITPQLIDNTLYDAFGQRQVSTMYTVTESVPRGDGGVAGVLAESTVSAAKSMWIRRADNRFR